MSETLELDFNTTAIVKAWYLFVPWYMGTEKHLESFYFSMQQHFILLLQASAWGIQLVEAILNKSNCLLDSKSFYNRSIKVDKINQQANMYSLQI